MSPFEVAQHIQQSGSHNPFNQPFPDPECGTQMGVKCSSLREVPVAIDVLTKHSIEVSELLSQLESRLSPLFLERSVVAEKQPTPPRDRQCALAEKINEAAAAVQSVAIRLRRLHDEVQL